MSLLSGRFVIVKAPPNAPMPVQELATQVEASIQELFSIVSSAQHGNLRFHRRRPGSPEDGDVLISANGSDLDVEVYDGNTSAWKTVTLS